MKFRVPKEIEDALNETGLPWSIEGGRKHFQVRLAGRLVGILPQSRISECSSKNNQSIRTQIRRTARALAGLPVADHRRRA